LTKDEVSGVGPERSILGAESIDLVEGGVNPLGAIEDLSTLSLPRLKFGLDNPIDALDPLDALALPEEDDFCDVDPFAI
jgi:hypothetical protein